MKDCNKLFNFEELRKIQTFYPSIIFKNHSHLFYENQVPCAGIILMEGCLEVVQGSKIKALISPGNIFGMKHLMEDRPFRYGCRICPESKVILIGKSQIKNFMQLLIDFNK